MNNIVKYLLLMATVTAVAVSAQGTDCSESKRFNVTKSQAFSGTFVDPGGAVLSGIKVQLLSGKKIVRDVRTDNLGRYDLGEVAPGKYTLRVEYSGKAFCAPKIQCSHSDCRIDSTLQLNPKGFVSVR